MEQILPSDEYTEFEDRVYNNPQVGVDQTNSFIDNYRTNQTANNQEIAQQTANLGTEVPSALGGLNTGTSYWASRFQTPQSNSAVADLRATAQAKALNDVLSNEEAKWKKRYTDAYRAYELSQYNKQNPSTSGDSDDEDEDNPDYESTGETLNVGENELVIPEANTTDTGATSAINAVAAVTGQGQAPTDSSEAGILIDKDGNRTAIKVYRGKGIEVAGGMSYTKEGAQKFLSDWVKNGGQVLNYTGGGNYTTNMLYWDLY